MGVMLYFKQNEFSVMFFIFHVGAFCLIVVTNEYIAKDEKQIFVVDSDSGLISCSMYLKKGLKLESCIY